MKSAAADILESAARGERISAALALDIYKQSDFHSLMSAAQDARMRLHPENIATYVVDSNINYSNSCVSGCKFCAYYKKPGSNEAFVLAPEQIAEKIRNLEKAGGTQLLLQGGLVPGLKIEFYEDMLRKIRSVSKVHIHALSPPEIVHVSRTSGIGIEETIERLVAAGLGSIPGGGAEILSDRVRKELSPRKCSTSEWLCVMRAAHLQGLRTTATMMFGHIETLEERIGHLEKIRALQDETGGFTAFISWTFQPANTALGGRAAGGVEYLKMLALSRLFLDNVKNIQASWVTQGPKVAEIALLSGANDLGGTTLEENVVRSAGASFSMNEKEMRRTIRNAGFSPVKRDTFYNLLERPDAG